MTPYKKKLKKKFVPEIRKIPKNDHGENILILNSYIHTKKDQNKTIKILIQQFLRNQEKLQHFPPMSIKLMM